MCIYIYIYRERERETYIYMYIDMYSLIEGVRCSLGSGFSLQSSASKNAKILKKTQLPIGRGILPPGSEIQTYTGLGFRV